jgi:hypothetical protein
MYEEPWTAGVLTLVGRMQPVRAPEEQIAAALGVGSDTVQGVLSALIDAGSSRTARTACASPPR